MQPLEPVRMPDQPSAPPVWFAPPPPALPPIPQRTGRGWMVMGIGGLTAGAAAIAIALGAGGLVERDIAGTAQPVGNLGGSVSSAPSPPSGSSPTTASADQTAGVVTINTVVGYGNGEAAGTGMVLSADGLILTNNHVIDGSTRITVTVVNTGTTYDATVVGTAPSKDVAVLKLADASGLAVTKFGSADDLETGDSVVAVGNSGGTGTPSVASGRVTALDQSIAATDESGANAEKLTGLIQTDADVVAGDSGGPLYDSSGEVVGINTAGASMNEQSTNDQSYAIEIDSALAIAQQIANGVDDDVITQGLPAFLGVELAPVSVANPRIPGGETRPNSGTSSVTLVGVIPGSPADQLGIGEGDTITGIDATAIANSDELSAAMAQHKPGDTVAVRWTGVNGQSHSGTAILVAGPAD